MLVSHKLDEVLHATDEITIMRQGRVVDHLPTREAVARSLARAMVGREVSLRSERAAFGLAEIEDPDQEPSGDGENRQLAETMTSDEPVLRIEGVTVKGRGGARLLDDISLDLRAGEIVGVAGVEGNGQRTLGDLLSSLVPLDAGRVVVNDKEVPTGSPGAMARGRSGGDPRRPP